MVEPLAKPYPGRCRVMHGRGDKFAPAEFQETSVTEPIARRPIQHTHRVGLGQPCAQDFASLVPVDQEDKRCADRFKKALAALAPFDRIAARDEIEHLTVKAFRIFAIKPAPLNRKILKEPGEKFGTCQMHVGVCDCHRIRLNADHDHMRVGLADVILNHEPRARPRCRGRKPRMTKFQLSCRLKPSHEGFDRWLVLRL